MADYGVGDSLTTKCAFSLPVVLPPAGARTTGLKTVDEHNRERQAVYTAAASVLSGVACPKCGTELTRDDSARLLSDPPKAKVTCSACGHHDYILA